MNLTLNSKRQTRNPKRESGSATILVFALLAIMVLYMNSNQLALHSLKRDLRAVEQKQLKKFQPPPKPAQP
jgi:hypothetical protein